MSSVVVREWSGKIIGYIDTDNSGNKTVRDFYKRVIGYYKKDLNATTDFYGKKLFQGDHASALIGMLLR